MSREVNQITVSPKNLPRDGEIEREPDEVLLSDTKNGPFGKDERSRSKILDNMAIADLHLTLWEILKRMDKDESAKFGLFISKLSALSEEEIERQFKIVKVFGFIRWLVGGIKWIVMFFIGGLGAMATSGDQLVKVIGYAKSVLNILKGVM